MGREDMLRGRNPFELTGDNGEVVLCLHGFTGSPGNYRKLARKLNEAGYTVSVPVLPGHGTEPSDMIGVDEHDWLQAAENAYQELRETYEIVHVVGLSLGGALSAKLASLHSEISSLILLAPAFAINPFIATRLGLTDEHAHSQNDKTTSENCTDRPNAQPGRMISLPARQPKGDDMDECIFGYDSFPASSAKALHGAGAMARQCCGQITVPTLVIYTAADMVVDPAACEQMSAEIPGIKQVVCLKESEHNVLLSNDRAEVYDLVQQFLRT